MNSEEPNRVENVCEILSLTEVQSVVYDLLLQSPPSVKHRIRSSLQGIMKSWGLKDLDENMACFRVITALEEAESAVIYSLKRRGYVNSDKLNPNNHTHKASILYIFAAFTELLPIMKGVIEGSFVVEPDEETGKKTPKMRFKFTSKQDDRYFYPIPPLGLQIQKVNGDNKELHNLEDEIKKLASQKGHENFLKYLKEETNTRNQILYASNKGIPHVSMDVGRFILSKSRYIFVLHMICLLIDFYREKQLLVQQLLDVLVENITFTKCES